MQLTISKYQSASSLLIEKNVFLVFFDLASQQNMPNAAFSRTSNFALFFKFSFKFARLPNAHLKWYGKKVGVFWKLLVWIFQNCYLQDLNEKKWVHNKATKIKDFSKINKKIAHPKFGPPVRTEKNDHKLIFGKKCNLPYPNIKVPEDSLVRNMYFW